MDRRNGSVGDRSRAPATRILLIEDDPIHARLVQIFLSEGAEGNFQVQEAHTLADGLHQLYSDHCDVIILDLDLPDSRDLRTFHTVKSEANDTPILIMATLLTENSARDAVRAGAYEALVKERLTAQQLRLSILHAVERKRMGIGHSSTQELVHTLMRCSNNAILSVKLQRTGVVNNWKILAANIHCRNILTSRPLVLEGEILHEVIAPSLFEDLDLALTRTFDQGECRGQMLRYEMVGVERWLQFDGIQHGDGVTAILTDMTPIKMREQELESARASAQKLLDEKTSLLGAICEKLPSSLERVHDRLNSVIESGKFGFLKEEETNLSSARAEIATLMTDVNAYVSQGPSAGFAYIGANYLTVLEMSPDLSAVVAASDGHIKFMNRIGRQVLGYTDLEDLRETSFNRFVPDDYSVLFEDGMSALRSEAMRVPMHLRGKDKQLVDVELQVVDCPPVGLDEWKGQDLVLISAADTTRRNRASRRIIAREEQLRKIMDNVADAIVVVDQNGCIETVNRSTEAIFGVPSRELVGESIGCLLGPSRDSSGRSCDGLEVFLNGGVPAKISGWRRHMGRRASHEPFPMEIAVRDLNLGERHLFIGLIRDISERVAYEENIMYMATHDMLTELSNRTTFHDKLKIALERAINQGSRFGLMFFDLDHFKSINNSYGHLVGDRVLSIFAKRITRCLDERAAVVARLSADEFVALVEHSGGAHELVAIAETVTAMVQKPIIVDHHDIRVSCSIGIAEYPDAGPTSEELIRSAEYAVRHAKDYGRGAIQVYDEELSAKLLYQQKLETALSTALDSDQFQLYYQPKVDLKTNEVTSAEALLRWFHPEIGLVSPVDFIPIAEESGQIRDIGAWVLHQVCCDLAQRRQSGLKCVPIAVNLSAVQFRDGNLATSLKNIMEAHNIPAELLELELTESALVENVDSAVETLRRLSDLGLSIAIDDFGSGYSSFGYLTRFPIDCLKIDRTFVRDIPFSKNDMTVTRAIIGMAKNLSLKIVAEGVETVEQAAFLKEHGCDTGQGYLYSRPVPFDVFAAMLSDGLGIQQSQ